LLFTVGHEIEGGTDALFALDSTTGAERWRVPSDSPLWAPSAGAGAAYVADEDGTLRAFEAATGRQLWSVSVGGYMRPAPAVVGPTLQLFGGSNEALGIDITTGRILWRIPIDGTVEYGTTAAGGRMFAVTTAGTLYAIGPQTLAAPTSAPTSATPGPQQTVAATLTTALSEAPGGLSVPTGLDADPKGRIWVAEAGVNGFAIFGADGAFLERWGSSGAEPGQFDFNNANSGNPTADIAFAPDGSFYVADTGNFRIQQFDAKREFVRAWGGFGTRNGQFAIPYALDLDARGNVYVTSGNGNIHAFTADGRYLRTIGEPGSGDGQLANAGLAVSGDRLLVADFDNHRVAVFGLDGTFIENWATREIGDPNAIDASPDGTVYVTSSYIGGTSDGLVHVLDRTGTVIGSFQAGKDPAFVTALGNGRVAVTGGQSGVYEVRLP
jgi:outer membrane protein assembly factor BamB